MEITIDRDDADALRTVLIHALNSEWVEHAKPSATERAHWERLCGILETASEPDEYPDYDENGNLRAGVDHGALTKMPLNRSALLIGGTIPHCASQTPYNSGAEILAAIKRRHESALRNAAESERKARSPDEWEELYAEAMKQKREARNGARVHR